MGYEEAGKDIYQSCGAIESALIAYISKHGAILSEKERDQLNRAISIAANGKFDPSYEEESPESIGGDVWERLKELGDMLHLSLHGQVKQ